MPKVAVVPAEYFVAAIASERNGHIMPGHLRDEKSWDLRRVGEGLVEQFWQTRYHVSRLYRRDIKIGVLGPQMLGYAFRVYRFIVTIFLKTDRKCMCRSCAHALHERHHGAGIDPTGE